MGFAKSGLMGQVSWVRFAGSCLQVRFATSALLRLVCYVRFAGSSFFDLVCLSSFTLLDLLGMFCLVRSAWWDLLSWFCLNLDCSVKFGG